MNRRFCSESSGPFLSLWCLSADTSGQSWGEYTDYTCEVHFFLLFYFFSLRIGPDMKIFNVLTVRSWCHLCCSVAAHFTNSKLTHCSTKMHPDLGWVRACGNGNISDIYPLRFEILFLDFFLMSPHCWKGPAVSRHSQAVPMPVPGTSRQLRCSPSSVLHPPTAGKGYRYPTICILCSWYTGMKLLPFRC